jgi:hypothetical protein
LDVKASGYWDEFQQRVADLDWWEILQKPLFIRWNELSPDGALPVADELFEEVRRHAKFKNHSVGIKRRACRKLVNGALTAYRLSNHGTIAFSRGRHCKTTDKNLARCMRMRSSEWNVAEILIDQGYFRLVKSKPGYSDHASRLVPLPKLLQRLPIGDEPERNGPRVKMNTRKCRDRESGEMIPPQPMAFDVSDPVAVYSERVLHRWLDVAKRTSVTYEAVRNSRGELPGLAIEGEILSSWPDLCRMFSGSFVCHGRLYDGKYGIQAITKKQRSTVCINGNKTIEPDFPSLHVRMAYNLRGHECPADVYPPRGDETAEAVRFTYKLMLNIMLNAKTRKGALAAFNARMRTTAHGTRIIDGEKVATKHYKTGGALAEAQQLQAGLAAMGLEKAAQLYDLIVQRNPLIVDCFGSDLGIKLMNYDSRIALDIVDHFAEKDILVLPIHDSFRIEEQHLPEMLEVMARMYERHIGFPLNVNVEITTRLAA